LGMYKKMFLMQNLALDHVFQAFYGLFLHENAKNRSEGY
jgi:hypothetical protein